MLAVAPPPAESGQIVVTASRVDPAPVTETTEIDREAITALQPASLLEVIDATPGVRAVSTGGIGGGSLVTVRGGEPNFTLVTIEGMKLNNPTNSRGGAFDFALIDPELVAGLSIVRGPGSAIHGSDALSGLIAIRLKAPTTKGISGSARLLGSSAEEIGANAGLDAGWTNGGVVLHGGVYRSGELDPASDLDRRQALAHVRQDLGGFVLKALAIHARTRRSTFPEDSGGPRLATNRALEHGRLSLKAGVIAMRRETAAAVRPNLSLSWSQQDDDVSTPFIAPGEFNGVPASTAHTGFRRLEAIADVALDLGAIDATVGGAVLRENGRSDGFLDLGVRVPTGFRLSRTTNSGFAETSWRARASLVLNLAGRIDVVDSRSTNWTWRGAARWRLRSDGPSLTAALGSAYKLPSFYALAHPLVGNSSLQAERGVSGELGLSIPFGRAGESQVTVFRSSYRNLVEFDPALFQFVNRAHVTTSGVEFEGRWHLLPELDLDGALTFLDIDSATPLRNRPCWQGRARMTWQPVASLQVTAQIRGNSSFLNSSIPTGIVASPGHVSIDLGVRYPLSSRFDVNLSLRDLTDAGFEDAVGFPAPGRRLRADVTLRY